MNAIRENAGALMSDAKLPPSLFIIDDLIKRGQLLFARRELKRRVARPMRRSEATLFASFAWRLNLPNLGLRILGPYVRSSERSGIIPTEAEKAGYAACLLQVGAFTEGMRILSEMDQRRLPLVLFLKAAAHVSQWEYGKALGLLDEFLQLESEPYLRQIAEVNRVAALIYEGRIEQAEPLLEQLMERTKRDRKYRLYGSLTELSALLLWTKGDYESMERTLSNTERVMKEQGGLNALFLRKWRVLLSLSRENESPETIRTLEQLRNEAARTAQWETIRDLDHLRAVHCHDEKRLWHVYFGTPFPNFRQKLLTRFGHAGPVPPTFPHRIGNSPTLAGELCLKDGTWRGNALFEPNELCARLLNALSTDFYRPIGTATLHEMLYPGERFNPHSSPGRVRQVIHRLRERLRKHGVPLTMEEHRGTYRLVCETGFSVDLVVEKELSNGDPVLQKLRANWPTSSFSRREAALFLQMPDRTLRRNLESGVSEGELARIGRGRQTRYEWKKVASPHPPIGSSRPLG